VHGLAPSGNVTVAGNTSASLSFVPGATRSITFRESGLPRNGTKVEQWCVALQVWKGCSRAGSLLFANLTPGEYSYTVVSMAGQTITARLGTTSVPLSGTLSVLARGATVSLKYVYPYLVSFTESGLSPGTNWSVTLKGVTRYSTTNEIEFFEPNGSYGYKVGAETGFSHRGTPSAAPVHGGSAIVLITFASTSGHRPVSAPPTIYSRPRT
jgi:hypothetical protein